ncbi:PAS domain-containing protein [Tenacibaculum piscium]|uniref:PAS domain-containing protein n=1 Tax=Tenacibaculum piscium TaxID=1458515 RepID=UPI001F226A5D|nr:PAS domain-containing protein [Tenacibaculum piscium]MCG8183339.1 PAS domain-containing protein [Tenacibaculum piscium]MCG8204477.1 PAS domain-containing protein [Tenacibaculum piscium]
MIKNPLRPQQIINEEIKWDKTQTIISKTDASGTILYMNDAFEAVSEYNKIELIGEPHNIIRHPDMPKIIFKVLWENLKGKKNFHAIVKNLTRTGRYYWVITDFTIDKDEKGNVVGYTGRRKSLPNSVVEKIAPLYKTLLEIEKIKGEPASKLYFDAYLKEEIGKSYDDFVVDLFTDESMKNQKIEKVAAEEKPKKGLKWFFSKN